MRWPIDNSLTFAVLLLQKRLVANEVIAFELLAIFTDVSCYRVILLEFLMWQFVLLRTLFVCRAFLGCYLLCEYFTLFCADEPWLKLAFLHQIDDDDVEQDYWAYFS